MFLRVALPIELFALNRMWILTPIFGKSSPRYFHSTKHVFKFILRGIIPVRK